MMALTNSGYPIGAEVRHFKISLLGKIKLAWSVWTLGIPTQRQQGQLLTQMTISKMSPLLRGCRMLKAIVWLNFSRRSPRIRLKTKQVAPQTHMFLFSIRPLEGASFGLMPIGQQPVAEAKPLLSTISPIWLD